MIGRLDCLLFLPRPNFFLSLGGFGIARRRLTPPHEHFVSTQLCLGSGETLLAAVPGDVFDTPPGLPSLTTDATTEYERSEQVFLKFAARFR